MKFLIIISLFLLVSCSSGSSGTRYWGGNSCTEPENPYSEGGHYEGFQWAESNGAMNCNWNSSSFSEWCEEYGRQFNAYNQCSR